jgi:methionyl-tRNA synthetase
MELHPEKPKNLAYDDFAKLDIRVGTIIAAEAIPKSKLLKLRVSFGDSGERTVLAGIGKHFKAEEIVGTNIVAVLNLAPREMKGIVSEAMLLAASNQDGSQLHLVQCPGSTEGREVG